jgi:hypothetical protein
LNQVPNQLKSSSEQHVNLEDLSEKELLERIAVARLLTRKPARKSRQRKRPRTIRPFDFLS